MVGSIPDEHVLWLIRKAVDLERGASIAPLTATEDRIVHLRGRVDAGRTWYRDADARARVGERKVQEAMLALKQMERDLYALLPACPHSRIYLRRQDAQNGAVMVAIWCVACDRNVVGVGYSVHHALLRRVGIDPRRIRPMGEPPDYPECAHCHEKKPGEYHHFAPQGRFRQPESWPVHFLCKDCHDLWHDVMGHGNEPWAKTEEQVMAERARKALEKERQPW